MTSAEHVILTSGLLLLGVTLWRMFREPGERVIEGGEVTAAWCADQHYRDGKRGW